MSVRFLSIFLLVIAAARVLPAAFADDNGNVKVFLLAGQSNMEGKAKVSLLEYQASQPETRDRFAHLRSDSGTKPTWKQRDDVWIKFLDRKGELTVGYGSPNCIGPELEFGSVIGDHFDEPVIIIKTAWGGKSLWCDFRPPSSRLPAEPSLQALLEDRRNANPDLTMEELKSQFGHFYREMIRDTRDVLDDIGAQFPELQERRAELAGAVWFQGWNDMINPDYTAEYAANMVNFIRDVRRDLRAPELPFVIGVMGVDGMKPNARQQVFRNAQAAPMSLPEFKDNVAVVQTGEYWDDEAHAIFKKGWKDHLDEWNKVGSDYPFHYLGSAKTMLGIGRGFAEAMIGLMK